MKIITLIVLGLVADSSSFVLPLAPLLLDLHPKILQLRLDHTHQMHPCLLRNLRLLGHLRLHGHLRLLALLRLLGHQRLL